MAATQSTTSSGLPFDISSWAPTDVGTLPTVWDAAMAEKVHTAAATFKGTPSLYSFPHVMQKVAMDNRRYDGGLTIGGAEQQLPVGSVEVGSVQW